MNIGSPLVISVTSGKGGVGKTNLAVNLSCCLARNGNRVVLLDADLGLANVDILLGLIPQHTLFHLFHEGVRLSDILITTPYGFKILPASSGVSEMANLTPGQKLTLLETMDELEESEDYLIVDTGAGINENVLYFNLASQERLVIMTPEPTSLTDAYALIKVLRQKHGVHDFHILVNMAPNETSARDIFIRLYKTCGQFLSDVGLDYVGFIPLAPDVRRAVIRQEPFCIADPNGPACRALATVAQSIQNWKTPHTLDGNIKFFWKRLLFRQ